MFCPSHPLSNSNPSSHTSILCPPTHTHLNENSLVVAAHRYSPDLDNKITDLVFGALGLDLEVLLRLVHKIEARQQQVKQVVGRECHLQEKDTLEDYLTK